MAREGVESVDPSERVFVSGEGGVCIDANYGVGEVVFAVVGRMDLGDGGVISAVVVVAVDIIGMEGNVIRCTDGESKPVLAMPGVRCIVRKLLWG